VRKRSEFVQSLSGRRGGEDGGEKRGGEKQEEEEEENTHPSIISSRQSRTFSQMGQSL
jgi:hypothetical protein